MGGGCTPRGGVTAAFTMISILDQGLSFSDLGIQPMTFCKLSVLTVHSPLAMGASVSAQCRLRGRERSLDFQGCLTPPETFGCHHLRNPIFWILGLSVPAAGVDRHIGSSPRLGL